MNKKAISRIALLCAVVLAVGTVAWAKNYHMSATKTVPGAAAEVNVEKAKNGDIQVDVNVKHLAKPGLMSSSGKWLRCLVPATRFGSAKPGRAEDRQRPHR